MAERIPLFPLHTLLLPTTDLGLHVFEERYRALVAHSLSNGHTFGVVLIKQGRLDAPFGAPSGQDARFRGPSRAFGGVAKPHRIGTLAHITGYARLPDGRYLLEVEGTRRFRITQSNQNGSYPSARVHWLAEPIGNFARARAASRDVSRLFHLYRTRSGDGDLPVHLPIDPVARSYVVASELRIEPPEKQWLLELESAEERLEAESEILQREIAVLEFLRMRR